jgi:flavin reductase (DIM6/NTAB) family NADH-FMN oxidoreductase RutF
LSREFRDALGRFATGVAIVTTVADDGTAHGMTVNSFSSVSLDPPLILWSLANDAYGRAIYEGSDRFCVNILTASQQSLAMQFATTNGEKYAGVDWQPTGGGAPQLAGCLACFDCEREAILPGGDHQIIVGRVHDFQSTEGDPLIFYRGGFGAPTD